MKKITSFLLIIISVFAISIVYGQSITLYKNVRFNYKITIPDKWEKEELPSKSNPENVTFKDPDGSSIMIYAKVDNSYSGKTANDMDAGTMYQTFQKTFKGAAMLESDYQVIDEIPALYCKYTYTYDGKEYEHNVYYLVKSDIFYMLNVVARKEYFDAFDASTRNFVLSFTIVNVTSVNYFRSDKFDFRITFPSGWKTSSETTTFGAEISDGAGVFVEVIKNDDFVGYVGNDLRADDMLEVFRTKYKDAAILDRGYLFIDNTSTMKVKYKCSVVTAGTKENFIIIHYYLVKGNILYILQGRALEKNFETYKGIIINSLESFEFLSNKKDN